MQFLTNSGTYQFPSTSDAGSTNDAADNIAGCQQRNEYSALTYSDSSNRCPSYSTHQ
jgi:hypothetical protein